PRDAGATLVGPIRVTVDASDPDRWVHFDFSRGSVVAAPAAREWDLAFRRFNVMVNGGPGFDGEGAAIDLGEVAFEAVKAAPDTGWVVGAAPRDSGHPALARWYDYGFTSHLLTPKPVVWAVRTADGRYVKMEILGYYCPGARAGCLTFRYVYQGDGSRTVRPASESATALHASTSRAVDAESRSILASIRVRSASAASSRSRASSRRRTTRW
ncbi:MAG: HmuY family protein, partial [Gemmatimonadetes bacterium]|nr:HmuY family protein [Gemmatimonadota bacterium]